MATSRSAVLFGRRHALVLESRRPAPRLALRDLLVHYLPLAAPAHPAREVLLATAGNPPPDRAGTRPWPSPEPSSDG